MCSIQNIAFIQTSRYRAKQLFSTVHPQFIRIGKTVEAGQLLKEMVLETSQSFRTLPSLNSELISIVPISNQSLNELKCTWTIHPAFQIWTQQLLPNWGLSFTFSKWLFLLLFRTKIKILVLFRKKTVKVAFAQALDSHNDYKNINTNEQHIILEPFFGTGYRRTDLSVGNLTLILGDYYTFSIQSIELNTPSTQITLKPKLTRFNKYRLP